MALAINIENLINRNVVESERIEFKKSWNPEDIMHSICAFANDINNWGGGYIVIGVEEKDGIPVLPPIGIKQSEIDSIQKKLIEVCRRMTSNYTPIISPEIYQDKHILVIYVPGGDARPYKAPKNWNGENVYWVRKGSSTVIASEQDEKRLYELANKIPFDDRINHQATIDDLSLPLIQGFLKEVGSDLYDQSRSMSFPDLCRQLNIVRGPSEDLRPVNAGLLFFSENPEKYFTGCVTEIIFYKDNIGDEFDEMKFKGPLHIQLKQVLNYIKSVLIKENVRKIEGQAEALRNFNYPYLAIEEAIANAFYHRSYDDRRTIEINIRKNQVEIISYLGPMPPFSKGDLKKERVIVRDSRNRRIGDFLKELDLTEGRGTGFPKIRRNMKRNGSPKPIFETDDNLLYFLTILPIHPIFLEITLTYDHLKILNFCRTPKSKKEILEFLGLVVKHENAQRHIKPLVDLGYLGYIFPDIPNTPKQQYVITEKAIDFFQRNII